MSAANLQNATERIERLERRLRRQTRGVIVCGVLVVAASVLIGQTPARRTVEAEQFILRGPQGQELATLDSAGTGAALALYDSQHHVRILLRSEGGFSGISLLDSGRKIHVAIASSDAEGPAVILTGTDLKSDAGISVAHNTPDILLHDEQGRIRGEFGLTEGNPMMRVYGSNSDTRAGVAVMGEVPLVSVGGPKLGSVLMTANEKGGELAIFKPDGKTITWVAPR